MKIVFIYKRLKELLETIWELHCNNINSAVQRSYESQPTFLSPILLKILSDYGHIKCNS